MPIKVSRRVLSLSQLWYAPRWYHWAVILFLLPFTLLFALLSALRRCLFRNGFKPSVKLNVPVIVVGNISVGGNGKTPLVVFLAQLLTENGYRPGVLTRGYGAKSVAYPLNVEATSLVTEVGDEPMLMRQHILCPLVVDPLRSRGAEHLVNSHACDVIICDDGLQHYALQRDIEIVVMDGQRRCGNQLLLPAGPLREGQWRLDTVDFIVVNGHSHQEHEYLMTLQPDQLVNIVDPSLTKAVNALPNDTVAAAGIGNPQRFFQMLNTLGIEPAQCISFPDHHQFTRQDFPLASTVVMTEKDAVKCRHFAKNNWWYLPVQAQLSADFSQQLLHKLQEKVQSKPA
jgi:tetraacyldisaccharide 4'-kinase